MKGKYMGFELQGETDMDKRCEKCGGKLIEGMLMDVAFLPKSEMGKLVVKKRSRLSCSCCEDCGAIQDFKAADLDRLR